MLGVQWEIRIRGELDETLLLAFPGFTADPCDGATVLTGTLPDQPSLHGVLAQIEALGLELLEVRCTLSPERDTARHRPKSTSRLVKCIQMLRCMHAHDDRAQRSHVPASASRGR